MCIICNQSHTAPLYQGIKKCPACSHAFADLSLSDEELFNLYKRNYFFGEEYSNYLADREILEKNFKLRMNVLNRFLDKKRHSHLLEIGCAYGFFLNQVKSQFRSVKGIDVCPEGIEYAQKQFGLNVIQGDFLKRDLGTFDVVCLWDTIEHLRDPHLYIEKIGLHAEKGALIAITTGDFDSFNARFRKEKWRLIHPPTHLHYFSKRSIEKLLNKNGFELIYNRHCGFYRSLDTIAHAIFVLRKKGKFLYTLLKKCGLTSFDSYLNLFDIMYVIGRKK